MNKEQLDTFTGKWTFTPIPLAVQKGKFNEKEIFSITLAAKSWNRFFKASQGYEIFELVDNKVPEEESTRLVSLDNENVSLIDRNGFYKKAVIYKITSNWDVNKKSVIGVTRSLSDTRISVNGHKGIYYSDIALNYVNFFTKGNKIPDLESVVLHELGHLIGLQHSCEFRTQPGMPDCRKKDLPLNYKEAVMFPYPRFNNNQGLIKNKLRHNDKQRSACLYYVKEDESSESDEPLNNFYTLDENK